MLVTKFKSEEGLQKTMVSVETFALLPIFSLLDTRRHQMLFYKHLATFDTKTTTRKLREEAMFRRNIPTIMPSREDLRDALSSDYHT